MAGKGQIEERRDTVKSFFKVVTPAEAKEILLRGAPVGTETLPTVRARGRVLAEDLYSRVDLPHFHRAAMDGYAVRARDTFGASAALPAYLKIAGTVEMGKEATRPLGPGEAMRISTGGMLPPGSDGVVMIEYTEEAGEGMVEVQRGVSPWQNVIQIGDDIKKGDLVFRRGRRLRSHDLGALTGIGVSAVPVYKKPRVALISTGDEIVEADAEPLPGQVRNINQHSLAGLIEEHGAVLSDFGVVRDDRSALAETLEKALASADLVLLSGGSSVGARDITVDTILSFARAEMHFHGISVSPGKPTIFATVSGKPVLGLPGYPVSALVIFDLFAAPLIRVIGGEDREAASRFRSTARAILKTNVASQPGREDYVRVTLAREGDRLYATPLPSKSGAIFTLVKADGMVKIDLHQEGLEAGEEVEVILF
ncbi:MAG TPA: gephyrin-like molybdotransferase Glp [Candidatus Acidoferrales bacterium]|nr:gephyrin-like molybdotransferase Glp [Candidatus Acidoferrales bacterium]